VIEVLYKKYEEDRKVLTGYSGPFKVNDIKTMMQCIRRNAAVHSPAIFNCRKESRTEKNYSSLFSVLD